MPLFSYYIHSLILFILTFNPFHPLRAQQNGSDALDKIRFLSLTNPEALKDQPELKLSVYADKESKTLSITDTGVGMTKEQLVQNLGVIAKSGTSEFLKEAENGTASDMGLIGQFGVGYACRLADLIPFTKASTLFSWLPIQWLWLASTMTTSSTSGKATLNQV